MFKSLTLSHLQPSLKLFVILAVLSFSACSKPPEFEYLNGSPGYFADLAGQWTVINYWAPWCKPCIQEIPELNKLNHEQDSIRVIGINFDQPDAQLLAEQAKELSIAFPNIVIANGVDPFMQYFGYEKPKALPMTVIISPDVELKTVLWGPQNESTLKPLMINADSDF